MKTPCKHAEVFKNQPRCYRPPFDELMALGGRTKRLMDFVRDDKEELALKELEEIRGVLDNVESKIKECKETSALKALREALEEAEAQAEKEFDEVMRPLWEAHPEILKLYVNTVKKAMNDRREALAPARNAYREAEVKSMIQEVEAKIKESLSEEVEDIGKCPECGLPATHPSGVCRDCHQASLEARARANLGER